MPRGRVFALPRYIVEDGGHPPAAKAVAELKKTRTGEKEA